jgi:antitoxin ParD1/3/4
MEAVACNAPKVFAKRPSVNAVGGWSGGFPERNTMNIDLSQEATQFIEGLVASGEYSTPEEAVADGIRLLMSRQTLRSDIQKGIDELDSGQGVEGQQVFAELRARAKKLTDQAD